MPHSLEFRIFKASLVTGLNCHLACPGNRKISPSAVTAGREQTSRLKSVED